MPAKDGTITERARIQVRARREGGRRRGGLRFTREWQTLVLAELTLEQVEDIAADPQLETREA
ncbi:hypothetical protein AN401_07240 [Zobellella denitrificans]|uniref:Mu-like prophage FluMu N-terminal domain-containing protein n=1 Tax=Zobellella denitrificans TaxID=347534 RepID=A0A291HND7_9GAMM|nr:hypothetical protein AN401_07240 [Zobellella denitrificans]